MTIQTKGVFVTINGFEILKNVSLSINEGEIVTLLGPNGAGKSTIVNVLSGDIEPQKGLTEYDERPIASIDIQERAFTRSVMSQIQPVVFDFSVASIIQMGWLNRGSQKYSNSFKGAVDQIIHDCEIASLIDRTYTHLSGGEQRRVNFARALLQLWRPSNSQEPKYLLLDEPTANLDLSHEMRMLSLIKAKAREGLGVLMVLHDLNLAARFSDKVVILKNGTVIDYGEPNSVMTTALLSSVYGLPVKVNARSKIITYY
jgi:iron complex transport system ATP-binding protein